jgi:hypothetical protein
MVGLLLNQPSVAVNISEGTVVALAKSFNDLYMGLLFNEQTGKVIVTE